MFFRLEGINGSKFYSRFLKHTNTIELDNLFQQTKMALQVKSKMSEFKLKKKLYIFLCM